MASSAAWEAGGEGFEAHPVQRKSAGNVTRASRFNQVNAVMFKQSLEH
jgi:hypothetical protein